MLDKLFHKPEQDLVIQSPHSVEAKRKEDERKKINHFFKRKGINPQTLYNTLTFITPFFHHRENEWEEFLTIILRESDNIRPDYARIQFWFLDTFDKSLNKSEAKYLYRYVKMSSIADDSETKLRDAMDNIDLPPIKYERWVIALYTLEGDEELDGIKEAREKSHAHINFVSKTLDLLEHFATAVGSIFPKENMRFRKTYPISSNEYTERDGRLNLTNKGAPRTRTRYLDNNFNKQKTTEIDYFASTDSTLGDTEYSDTVDLTRCFHA
jgi:hypothetical protein